MSEQKDPKVEIETLSDDDLESVSGGSTELVGSTNTGTGTCGPGSTNTGTGTCGDGSTNSGTGTCN
jgi:bacteriocin-like protein